MSSIKTTQIDGDVSVGRNVAIGGKARIAGSAIIGHNLKVEGWLEAPNIKDINNKGLFASSSALEAAYPTPRVGWWAMVGDSSPFAIYRCNSAGTWTATGGTASVSLTIDAETIAGWVSISSTSELPEDPTDDERGKGYLLGTVLYVYVGTGGDTLDGLYQSAQLKGETGTTVNIGEADIADNLTTDDATKVLSAKQGKVLKDAVDEVNTLLDEYVVSETTQLTIYNAGAGVYINPSAKIASGSNTYSVKYFEVEAGKKVRLTLGYSGSGTIASNAYAAAWFTSQPHYQDVGVLAIQDNLETAISNSPIILSVPTGVTHLAVTMMSTGGSASAEYIEDYLDVVQMSDIEDEIKAVDEVTEEVMIVPTTSQLSAQFISQTSRKIAGASLQGYYVLYVPCVKGDKFVIRFSGDFSSVVDTVGAAWFAAVQPANNSALLMPAIMDGEDGMKLNSVTANHDYEVTVPSGALWLCVQKYSTNTTTIHKKVRRVDSEKMTTKAEWSVPDTIYAVVGKQKRLYLDCIIKNYDNLIVGLPWGTYTSALYIVQNCLIFNPSSAGTTEVTLFAYDLSGNVVGSKTISIVTIANALPQTSKRVCILGDSITEVQNMAYYMENELKRMFGDDNTALPQFCGTKIKSYAAGGSNKLTRNEGHYGHSYSWLLGSSSPFYNAEKSGDDKIDIANWRTADGFKGGSTRVYNGCGLQANEKIDVLSLAMGHNGTADKESAATQLEALKSLIAYFKEDNQNTKFIIQMIPLLGGNKNVDKLNSLYYWRELVLNDEDFATDDNIIIGDMGCCYDRWNAYNREFVVPDTCYPNDEVEIYKVDSGYGYATADTQHPSAEGSQQLGEGAIPALLAMVQEVGTEDGEELTTYTPTAVVTPEPVTLQSLNNTKANKQRTVEVVTATYDLTITDNGDPFTAQELSDGLDQYLDGWEEEPAALALYNNIVADISARTISNVTTSKDFYNALNSVGVEFDSEGKDAFMADNYTETVPTLTTDNYVDYGSTSSVSPTLPSGYTRAEEYLFTFTCSGDDCTLILPNGTGYGRGLDFDTDKKSGRKFQMSIQDGIVLYTYIDLP